MKEIAQNVVLTGLAESHAAIVSERKQARAQTLDFRTD